MNTSTLKTLETIGYSELYGCPDTVYYNEKWYKVNCPDFNKMKPEEALEALKTIGYFFEDDEGKIYRIIEHAISKEWVILVET